MNLKQKWIFLEFFQKHYQYFTNDLTTLVKTKVLLINQMVEL